MTHHIFVKNEGWLRKVSTPHPTLPVKLSPCPSDHADFGQPVSNAGSLQLVAGIAVGDTGCQCTCLPPTIAYKMGFKRTDFLNFVTKMTGADKSDLEFFGAVVAEFSCLDESGSRKPVTT